MQFFTYKDAFETEANFSAMYKPDFMMKVLDLQQKIEALKTEGTFTQENGNPTVNTALTSEVISSAKT